MTSGIYAVVSCAGGDIGRENLPFWKQIRNRSMDTVGAVGFNVDAYKVSTGHNALL